MEDDAPSKATLEKEREERIRERRERIMRRIEAQKVGGEAQNIIAERERRKKEDYLQPRKGLDEVDNCRRRMARFDAERNDQVSEVRVLTDDRETKRRTNEEALRVDRRHKLLFEAESSARRNAAISMKWTVLYQIDIPMDLHQEMKAQEAACWRIIEAKDNLIRDFQAELKAKDEQYVKALRQGVQDLDLLQDTMARNASRQRLLFEQELQNIETAFENERTELVDTCRKQWDDLFERSYQQNMRHKALREKRVDLNQNRLMLVQRHDTEDFYTLKVRLETEVQNLEQQLEDMRATYQLNTEKLEYNFRVLHERNQENHKTITANKRKLARLQDNLSNLKNKYASMDAKLKAENQELTEAFKRYTQLLMDLGDKLSRFIAADSQRFEEVWTMHEDEVKGKLLRLLQADKLIHEQQLGLLWFPPSEQQLNEMFEQQRKESFALMRKRMLVGNPNMKNATNPEAEAEEAEQQRELAQTILESPAIREMCQMITDNTDFLQDAPLKKLLASLPRDKSSMLAIKNVFKALGIQNRQDAQVLQLFFTSDAQHATPEQVHQMVQRFSSKTASSAGSTAAQRQAMNSEDMVSETEVVDCLKQFLTYRNAIKAEEEGEGGEQSPPNIDSSSQMPRTASGSNLAGLAHKTPRGATGMSAGVAGGAASKKHVGVSVDPLTGKKDVLSGNAAASIWKACANVVPETTIAVWRELYKFLSKYNLILQERRELIDEVDALRAQNRELKMLLNQYLTSKVNGQLYVPPTATISRVDT